MGAGQSLQHMRGREAPATGLSRLRGTQADARTSHSHSTIFSDVFQQPQQNLVRVSRKQCLHGIYALLSLLRKKDFKYLVCGSVAL